MRGGLLICRSEMVDWLLDSVLRLDFVEVYIKLGSWVAD